MNNTYRFGVILNGFGARDRIGSYRRSEQTSDTELIEAICFSSAECREVKIDLYRYERLAR